MVWTSRPSPGCWATTAPGLHWTPTPTSPPRRSGKRRIPWQISSPVLLRTNGTFPRMGQNLGLAERQKVNHPEKCGKAKKSPRFPGKSRGFWLRGPDLNRRPSGYEPDELPDCSTPRYFIGAGDRGRTGTGSLPRDFKSRASANSATPADYRWLPVCTDFVILPQTYSLVNI